MTTEAPKEETAYAQFAVPDLAYSAIRVPLTKEWVEFGVEIAAALRAAYMAEFFPESPPAPEPAQKPQDAPQQAQPPPRAAPAPQGASRPAQRGSGLFCPEHVKVEVVLSKDEYQPKDVDGSILRDKFYCPGSANGTGKNHNVWRSAAVEGERR